MDIKELVMTLIVVGILFSVMVLIFSSVSNSTDNLIDPTRTSVSNESVTIGFDDAGADGDSDNSTLLAQIGYIENSETVVNGTGSFVSLTRNVDYKITVVGSSGELDARANFTLINMTNTSLGGQTGFNNSALFVSYAVNEESAAQASVQVIESTVLDSFELGVIALLVLAAVVILGVLFKLGST